MQGNHVGYIGSKSLTKQWSNLDSDPGTLVGWTDHRGMTLDVEIGVKIIRNALVLSVDYI